MLNKKYFFYSNFKDFDNGKNILNHIYNNRYRL